MSDLETVRPITLEDAQLNKYAFLPQDNITPLESVLIAQLFTRLVMTAWKGGPLDWQSYILENKLDRHFMRVDRVGATMDTSEPAPARMIAYIAKRDDGDIKKGATISLIEGMPVLEPWVEATPENVVRIQNECDAAGATT